MILNSIVLLCFTTAVLAGCFVDFPPLPSGKPDADLGVSVTDGKTLPDRGVVKDQSSSEHDTTRPPDKGTPDPDKGTPDLPSTSTCKSWNDWTCTSTPGACNSQCPKTGTAALTLTCNKSNCICRDAAGSVKTCPKGSDTTCSDCQNAFAQGCCSGL